MNQYYETPDNYDPDNRIIRKFLSKLCLIAGAVRGLIIEGRDLTAEGIKQWEWYFTLDSKKKEELRQELFE